MSKILIVGNGPSALKNKYGELIDSDGTVFKSGEFVSFEPGSKHSSYSKNGALIVVFQRGLNEAIDQD